MVLADQGCEEAEAVPRVSSERAVLNDYGCDKAVPSLLCYSAGRFAWAQIPRWIALNSWALHAFFHPEVCGRNTGDYGKCRRQKIPNTEFFSTSLDSLTLPARPGACFLSAVGQALGWPHCGLSSECLSGAAWEERGNFGQRLPRPGCGGGK